MTIFTTSETTMVPFLPYSSLINKKLSFLIVIGAVFAAGFCKIADLDFWWHLKTGELIVHQRQFQYKETYSFTAAGREYIDHEWLFQIIQYLIYSATGSAGIILFKCLLIAFIYVLILNFLLKQQIPPSLAVAVLLLSIAGGIYRFIERPELFTILFMVLTYISLHSFFQNKKTGTFYSLPLLFMIWANTHAAVILGLLLMLAFITGYVLEHVAALLDYPEHYLYERTRLGKGILISLLCLGATMINPYGIRVLKVPFELTALIDTGILNNQEWQQPSLPLLPFYYLCLLFTFAIFLYHFRTLHIPNFLISAFLAYISLKYKRNIGVFSILMPLLTWPYLFTLAKNQVSKKMFTSVAIGSFFTMILFWYPFERGIGEASYFPDRIVDFTRRYNLSGNMLNSYGFGGYLIWSLYPERKIFIDGRNEVYWPLMLKIKKLINDNFGWKQLLQEYKIEYAILHYLDELEVVKTIHNNRKITISYQPFTSTRFPRSKWALVYWDDDGMVFIKRDGINHRLVSMEYKAVFPEGKGYQQYAVMFGQVNRQEAIRELQRKLSEQPDCQRARSLLQSVLQLKGK